MKKILLATVLFLSCLSAGAQEIANIEVTSAWNYVYDAKGKKLFVLSRSQGEVVDYSSKFFIVKNGAWYYFYSPTGKKINVLSVSYVGEILSASGDTFTSKNGSWIYTWSKEGKKISTRSANQ